MNLKKERDYLRLTNNEPLVLAVSALSDFLWEDFVRDTSPTVTYLIDQYNVNQLSRFGKELFDFLYNSGAVTPLVSLDDVETYFRAKQNGANPEFPAGYKPESAFWVALFAEICNAPAWPRLMSLSCGDQFNAGNNAVNILNELSEVLEAQIEKHELPIDLIAEGGQKLEELRQAFLEAKAAGDDTKAAEIREKGKSLGKAIEQAVEESRQMVQPEISRALDSVERTANETQNAINSLAGTQPGKGKHSNDLEEKRQLAKKLQRNPSLKRLINKLGGLKRAWNDRKRAKRAQSTYSEIVGAKFSDEVIRAFPAELALAATDEGRALFALKYAQRTILTKDYEAKIKEVSRGPVVMYVDVSGSMCGEAELWSKALAYVVAEECVEQNRELRIHLFDTQIQKSIHLDPARSDNAELLKFVLSWTTHGGTSFSSVIDHALNSLIDPKADVLMITDGQAEVSDPFIRRLSARKDELDLQWTSFCIGVQARVLSQFSDDVQLVDIQNDPESATLFQNALR
jgi:uncharacterized protein with von Willebrand factor type A (vWA) domain